MAERDRSFGPTVLVGLAATVLTAVAATRSWATATGDASGIKVDAVTTGAESSPLTAALALVALAAWGALLVLRGQTRRVVAVLGLLAVLGALVGLVDAFDGAQDDALEALAGQGTGDVAAASLTGWYWVTGVGGVIAAVAFVVAVTRSSRWPAMGSRYDAPSARAAEPRSDEDIWRAIDDGRDPTS